MKKIAQGIVRLRKLILTVAFLLLIPSAIGAIATRINYDILTYLPQDLDSMIGEVALEDDFHLASTGMITVEGLPTNELIAMKKEIEAVPGVPDLLAQRCDRPQHPHRDAARRCAAVHVRQERFHHADRPL